VAHFAKLDKNNIVVEINVINNDVCSVDGVELEDAGIAFLKSLYGQDTNWKQTSYNGNIRKNYAGIGYTYDAARDAFIPPQPSPEWTLDEDTCQWINSNPPEIEIGGASAMPV
jgi:hypothetical protein